MKKTYTWIELNALLKTFRREEQAQELYKFLRASDAPIRWLERTFARFRQLRKERERKEFHQGLKDYKGPRTPKKEDAA